MSSVSRLSFSSSSLRLPSQAFSSPGPFRDALHMERITLLFQPSGCFRLYSSEVFHSLASADLPSIRFSVPCSALLLISSVFLVPFFSVSPPSCISMRFLQCQVRWHFFFLFKYNFGTLLVFFLSLILSLVRAFYRQEGWFQTFTSCPLFFFEFPFPAGPFRVLTTALTVPLMEVRSHFFLRPFRPL